VGRQIGVNPRDYNRDHLFARVLTGRLIASHLLPAVLPDGLGRQVSQQGSQLETWLNIGEVLWKP